MLFLLLTQMTTNLKNKFHCPFTENHFIFRLNDFMSQNQTKLYREYLYHIHYTQKKSYYHAFFGQII